MAELSSSSTECPSHLFSDWANADVSFGSADGKVFHVQRKYLEVNTGGFPSADFDTQGELIHLTESSVVLEALFRFAYPIVQPDLEDVSFEDVAAVAEAAEKYEVFSAMNFCRLRMRRFLPKHAVEILGYAAKHNYDNVVQEAVPYCARLPLIQVFNQLPTFFFRPWIKYHEAWKAPFNNAFQFLVMLGPSELHSRSTKVMRPPCQACGIELFTMIRELRALQSLDELVQALAKPRKRLAFCLIPKTCGYCEVAKQITTDITIGTKNIPLFKTFLREG